LRKPQLRVVSLFPTVYIVADRQITSNPERRKERDFFQGVAPQRCDITALTEVGASRAKMRFMAEAMNRKSFGS
jgi:hypothetical protein